MNHATEILAPLFIVFISAQIGAEIAQRLKLPAVVGLIAAGCIIGPSGLGLMHITDPLEVLSELGAVLLLFAVGLETNIGKLTSVGKHALTVGVLGVVFPFILGIIWAYFSGFNTPDSFFVASAFVATSAGITASALQELGALDQLESRIILAAAIIDDILAMLLLAVVTSLRGDITFSAWAVALIVFQAIAFVAVVGAGGAAVMKRSSKLLDKPINPLSPLSLSLAGCLGLALAAAYFGLAAIIGAFLAGVALAESEQQKTLEHQLQPILTLLVPFFFVVTGAKVVLAELSSSSAIIAVIIVTILAIVGKLVGCGLGAISLGKRSALIIGVGMSPRGEVGVIIASLGQLTGVFSPQMFAIIVAMSLLTSMVAPPILGVLLKRP